MRLKKHYSAREVTALTGLTARQLRWWDARRVAPSSIASRRTEAGGYTERRYSPIELYELLVMADLRRRGFTVGRIRQLVETLRERFRVRLFDAIGDGPLQLLTDGSEVFVRTEKGEFYNLRAPDQPLLVIGSEGRLREIKARVHRRRSTPRPQPSRAPRKREAQPGPAVPEPASAPAERGQR
ncbi:MAG: MerR family transcriptional regulator [Vicinamibacterales bacterium]